MTGSESAPWIAVSAAFDALGRAFLCLDGDLRVLHCSSVLDELLGPGAASGAEGLSAEELLGAPLFGPAAPLRQALLGGERREGFRAILRGRDRESRPRLVSVMAAPIHPPEEMWDPRVAFVVVLHPAEDEHIFGESALDDPVSLAESEVSSRARRLQSVLEEHHWRRSEAARALGISRTTLWRMMREAGIEA